MAGHTLSPVDSTAHSSSLPQSAHFLDQSLHHMPGLSSGSVHFLEFSALLVSVKLSFLSLVLNLPFADVSILLADALGSSPAWGEVLHVDRDPGCLQGHSVLPSKYKLRTVCARVPFPGRGPVAFRSDFFTVSVTQETAKDTPLHITLGS